MISSHLLASEYMRPDTKLNYNFVWLYMVIIWVLSDFLLLYITYFLIVSEIIVS